MNQEGHYAFGDDQRAIERLAIVAEIFDATSREFVRSFAPAGASLSVDLGCGPGFTSRVLMEELQPRRLVGIDVSEPFLAAARRTHPSAEFRFGDVTGDPQLGGPADVLYCRLLLSHLSNPAQALSSWLDHLRPGGRLLIEEVESIDTGEAVFEEYLRVLASVMSGRKQTLYVGKTLAYLRFGHAAIVESRLAEVRPPTARVATMFGMNLHAWGRQPDAQVAHGEATIEQLSSGLRALEDSPGVGEITWFVRQIALERR